MVWQVNGYKAAPVLKYQHPGYTFMATTELPPQKDLHWIAPVPPIAINAILEIHRGHQANIHLRNQILWSNHFLHNQTPLWERNLTKFRPFPMSIKNKKSWHQKKPWRKRVRREQQALPRDRSRNQACSRTDSAQSRPVFALSRLHSLNWWASHKLPAGWKQRAP